MNPKIHWIVHHEREEPLPALGDSFVQMREFTFEIVEQGKVRFRPAILTLPNERALWGCVEALALRLADREGPFIRVKDSRGNTLVRAGVSTALASVAACRVEGCPLKRELSHYQATGQNVIPDLHIDCATRRAALAG